ncbi:MAG: EAL domain-containing protein [Pseudomonadota bacterium]
MTKSSAKKVQSFVPDLFIAARGLQTPTWVYDIDNCRIVYANERACHMWQSETEEELCARDLAEDMSPAVAQRLKQYQSDFIDQDASFHEMWTLYPNGVPTSVMVMYRGFRLSDGRMAMQCEVLGDAEELPDNLRSTEALLHTDVMIALFGLDEPSLYMNPAAHNAFRDSKAPLKDLFVKTADYDVMAFQLEGRGEYRMLAQVKVVSGKRWFDLSAKICKDAVTGSPAILLTAIDVSELKNAKDKAKYLADRDQLTGCFNRTFLQQHMASLRDTIPKRSALLYFDLDRFKQVNDTHGHEAGDTVLRMVVQRASDLLEPNDFLIRLGGDEFVVLVDEGQSQDNLESLIKRLIGSLSMPVTFGSINIGIGISLGAVTFNTAQDDLEAVLRKADIALYTSKKDGRGQYNLYDEAMGRAALERQNMEKEIQRALDDEEFILHYQPRIDLASGRIAGFEGLARWQHPERGIVMPGGFIPICEETGMIEQLGQQVLDIGFQQALNWTNKGFGSHFSLNLSPRQFADDGLLDTLQNFSDRPDFPHGKIELELTETVLIGDLDSIVRKLEQITDMGYKIAIDDFGTGYSNLSYISKVPLSCIKIDRSFIDQLPKSGPIIGLILALGNQIGATIVAEGVETKEQYDWLREHKCDQVQGFYISKAEPISDFEDKMNTDFG